MIVCNFRPSSGQAPLYQTWTYDKSDRNTQARDLSGGLKTLRYDPASRLVAESLPGRVKSEYQYDAANRLLDLRNLDGAGSLLARSKYSLDAVGNRMSKETISDKESYSYDKTYQLTGVRTQWADLEIQAAADPTLKLTDGVTKTVAVSYDPMGNRQSYDEMYTGGVPALHKAYSHDDANEMTSDGGISQTYDDNGNLTGRGSETLGWDARNRLVSDYESGKDDWTATYDYNNRIANRQVGVSITTMVYDDFGRLLAEIDEATGKPRNLYSYDAVGLWAQTSSPATGNLRTVYPLFDGLGSTLGTVDGAGNDVDRFSYGAYGEEDGNFSSSGLPFRYTGRWGGYTDPRAGVLNWNRWYLQEAGRWGSRDPIGIWGGVNLYNYSTNGYVGDYDATGLLGIKNCQDIKDKIERLKKTLGDKEKEYKDNDNGLCNVEPVDTPAWASRYQHMLYILYLRGEIAVLQKIFDDSDCNNKMKGTSLDPVTAPQSPVNLFPGGLDPKKTLPIIIIPIILFSPVGA